MRVRVRVGVRVRFSVRTVEECVRASGFEEVNAKLL